MRDRHIIKKDTKVSCATDSSVAHERRQVGAIGEELVGVELRDDSFEDLVADGGKDFFVVLEAEVLHDEGEFIVSGRERTHRVWLTIWRSLVPETEEKVWVWVRMSKM